MLRTTLFLSNKKKELFGQNLFQAHFGKVFQKKNLSPFVIQKFINFMSVACRHILVAYFYLLEVFYRIDKANGFHLLLEEMGE
jgi:hypothetical protein